MTRHAFICDAVRTPFGRYGGALSSVRADDLGAIPLAALMARNPNLDWQAVSDVIFGATFWIEKIWSLDGSAIACAGPIAVCPWNGISYSASTIWAAPASAPSGLPATLAGALNVGVALRM